MVMRPPFLLSPRVFWGRILTPPANCVCYLPMYPPNVSPTLDYSANTNVGTISGATWGQLPSGLWYLDFDGATDIVTVADHASLDIVSALTLELWVNATDTGNESGEVISKRAVWLSDVPYELRAPTSANDAAKRFVFYSGNGADNFAALSAHNAIDYGNWQHVVATYNKVNAIMYINGAVSGTPTTDTWDLITNATDVTIGSNPSGQFLGKLALIRIYNVALSATQIAGHYNQERGYFGV